MKHLQFNNNLLKFNLFKKKKIILPFLFKFFLYSNIMFKSDFSRKKSLINLKTYTIQQQIIKVFIKSILFCPKFCFNFSGFSFNG